MEGDGGGGAPSLGLMKGVMLCNRPIPAEVTAAAKAAQIGPWKTGVKSELVHPKGRDPLLEALSVRGSR